MPRRVLIVEDDPFIALDLESLLLDAGYEVLGPAASSQAAMAILADPEQRPDCALIDFYITGGTSEFIARELVRLDVPFVMVSANKSDALAALSDQKPTVRSKPVQPRHIMADVETMVA